MNLPFSMCKHVSYLFELVLCQHNSEMGNFKKGEKVHVKIFAAVSVTLVSQLLSVLTCRLIVINELT